MPKNKIGLKFDGWEKLMANIDKMAGMTAMQEVTKSALKATKSYVNSNVMKIMAKSNLPAKGKYSAGLTLDSLDNDFVVAWSGYTAEIAIGFDFDVSGLRSIFLMYGTPKMKPVAGLKNAIYGNKTKKEISKIQSEAVNKYITRHMGG